MKKLIIAAGILLLAAGGYWYWQMPERLESTGAVVEGRLAEAAAAVSGHVAEIYVRAGETVAQGQPLLALDASGYEAALAEERARLAELAASLPPDLRVPSPLGGTPQQGKPLAELRREEEEARKAVDVAAHVHAAASVELSRRQKPGAERQKALITRDEAAIALQKARETFERASYARARREAQDKTAGSGGTVSAALAARLAEYQARISRVRLAEQNLAGTVVLAPSSGRVLLQAASPGASVAAGDVLAAILPDDVPALAVNALFAARDAAKLAPGQECAVFSPDGKELGRGRIGEIGPSDSPEKDVAVRVDLDENSGLAAAPGEKVTVRVTLPKQAILTQNPAQNPGGKPAS